MVIMIIININDLARCKALTKLHFVIAQNWLPFLVDSVFEWRLSVLICDH